MKKNEVIVRETGIVRRIDELGRIAIPKIIREEMGVKEGDAFEFFFDVKTKAIYIKKYKPFN